MKAKRGPKATRISLGLHAIREVMKVRPSEIIKLIVRKNWESSSELKGLVAEAKRRRIIIEEKPPEFIDRWGAHNQGVACEVQSFGGKQSVEDLGDGKKSIVLILDGVEDPHNLGAILRTSWLIGVEAVIIPLDRAVGFTPTVHKVSCGGIEHVPVIQVPNLVASINQLKQKGFWIYGLAAGGKQVMGQFKVADKVVWVLGAEDKGLRITSQRACDELVAIPQLDNAASYNVSVATGITLFETLRQFRSEKL